MFDREIIIPSVLLWTVLLGIGALIADSLLMKPTDQLVQVTVLDRQYQPSRTSVSVGPVFGNDGSGNPTSGITVLSSTSSEKWIIVFRQADGDIHSQQVKPETFYAVETGNTITMVILKGPFRIFTDYRWLNEQ